jgi:hypothetical protein
MRSTSRHGTGRARGRLSFARTFVTALAFAASLGFSQTGAAAEIDLSGTGTFKPPSAEQVARLPADLVFTRQDLASGTWSFLVRYEERSSDTDPDPYVGRYKGAIRMFQLTVGATTVNLPVDRAELVVSDGGLGFPYRESVRLEASEQTPHGVMRAGWIQLNQPPSQTDLRGAPGVLPSDAMPEPSTVAKLSTHNAFDRFFLLRLDQPGAQSQPLFYISSSDVSVLTRPAALK